MQLIKEYIVFTEKILVLYLKGRPGIPTLRVTGACTLLESSESLAGQ